MDLEEKWNHLVDCELVSQETVDVICGIWGNTENNLNDVVFYTCGYRTYEDWIESEKQID